MVSDERASAALLELLEKRQSIVLAPISARGTRLFFRSNQGASVGEFDCQWLERRRAGLARRRRRKYPGEYFEYKLCPRKLITTCYTFGLMNLAATYPRNPRRVRRDADLWYRGRETLLSRKRLERATAALNAQLVEQGKTRVSQESLRLRALELYLDSVEKRLGLPPLG